MTDATQQAPRGAPTPLPGVEMDAVTRASLEWLAQQAGYKQNVAIAEGVELLHAFVVALAAGGGPVRLPYPRQLPNGQPVVLTITSWRRPRWRAQGRLFIIVTLIGTLVAGIAAFL